ncbi:ABC transporter permease [Streptococcus porcinus]|uniref:ABC transporter permease n=1 Tax=Streptococcus porcinus TaxID=1340 RepID=UPI0019600297|nr:ABC transporter permease [Streptococcus porcinus]
MFGKLLKYEFRSVGKWYFGLNAGIVAIAAILSFVIKILVKKNPDISLFSKFLPFSLILIFGALIAGSLLATLLIIINRFNKNIYGREGYLTMTLPVSEHKLILAKLLSSVTYSFFNLLMLAVAFAILILPQFDKADLLKGMNEILKVAPQHMNLIAFICVTIVLSTLSSILAFYFAISIGQLFSNRRGLKAFIAYFCLQITLSIIFTYINTNLLGLGFNREVDYTSNYYFLITSLEGFFQIILYYFGTHFIMKYKLNLQ